MILSRRAFMATGVCAPVMYNWAADTAFARAPADDIAQFIAAMPKAEYHIHLEGSLEPEMRFALARRNGMTLPYADVAAMKRSYVFNDLPTFLAVYYAGMSVLQNEQDFYDLCYAYLAKAHSQNVLYAEMFFDPQQHYNRGVPIGAVIGGITRARADATAKLGIQSQLILCLMRDLSAENAMTVLDAALPYRDEIVGLGLDSDEKDNPPGKFAAHVAKARAAGLKVTMHCDINQKDILEHIRAALIDLAVDRIDHGGNILQSPELIAVAKQRNIYFTVCPSFSGRVTVAGKPVEVVRGMLDQGLNVTINSDDPAYMGGEYITEAMIKAQRASQLSKTELVKIERNAFEMAWIEPARRDHFLGRLDEFSREHGVLG